MLILLFKLHIIILHIFRQVRGWLNDTCLADFFFECIFLLCVQLRHCFKGANTSVTY